MTTLHQGWLVARREMRERTRSRGFRISLLLMVIVVVAMVVVPGLLDKGSSTQDVGVSGTSSVIFEQVLANPRASRDTTIRLHHYDSRSAGEKALRDERVDVLVVDGRRLEWRGKADAKLQSLVTGALQLATVQERAAAAGVAPGVVARMLSPVPVDNVQIGAVPGRSENDDAAAALMTVVLLLAIVIYGNLVLTGVVEEKSSRVVEVLLARIPARALLGGKVVGIGLLGFGQLAVTAVAALAASMTVDQLDIPAVSGTVLAWVLVWFVLGYAVFAMIYGALGSLASRTEDAQAVAGPVSYVMVGGYWLSFLALNADPDGLWSRVLSLFPVTAPLAMPGRIALGATDWWEPPVAALIALAAIVGLVALAGRIYQNAVLRTGAVIHLRDAWRTRPADAVRPPRTPPRETVTLMFASAHRPLFWTVLLTTAGVTAAVLILTLTHDVIWSVVALLITVIFVRRVLQHR